MSVIYGGDKITFSDGSTVGNGWSGFKNRIINGAMMIDQRNAGASVTPASGDYTIDRWVYFASQASKFTAQQSSVAPSGFTKSLLFTTASAVSVGASDTFQFQQPIEGLNVADLGWGTANAQTVTLSFWVRSSLTGTFGGALKNPSSRSYPFAYTISTANTWEQKSIVVVGDTSGTWATDNSAGIRVAFGLGSGSTFSGTAGSWQDGNLSTATGATSVVGTSGATFYITGVQLEKGSTATSFDYRPYGTELALCQRYYWQTPKSNTYGSAMPPVTAGQAWSSTNAANFTCPFPTTMRANPSLFQSGLQIYSPNLGGKSCTVALGSGISPYGTQLQITGATSLTGGEIWFISGTSNTTDFIGFGAEL
jgi:hypothetical protein